MTTSLELARSLEAARLASGVTLQALTARAGVSRQAVYRLFKGNDVQVSTLLAVMEVLHLDLVTLPRALKRSLPELGAASVPAATTLAQPAPATPPPSHLMSAVQQRLADLKGGRT